MRPVRLSQLIAGAAALVVAGAVAGCNEDPGADNGEGDYLPDPLPASTAAVPEYPAPPYDLAPGGIIRDYEFPGFPNAAKDRENLTTIRFADFYNPNADDPAPFDPPNDDRLFPPGSPYGEGTPKPRALVVAIGSVWCGPCNQEAKSLLPVHRTKYKPCGGEIFYLLVESNAPGTEATKKDLQTWSKKYKVDYPIALDASRQLSQLYSSNTFPASAIIDTRTMEVVETLSGPPEEGFWVGFEDLLDANCLAEH